MSRHPVRSRVGRLFACECQAKRRKCTDTIYMNLGSYKRAAAMGRVVSLAHVDGPVVERSRTYAIVEFVKDEALV